MFELEQFTADCRAALAADKSHKSVREVVARAVWTPLPFSRDWANPSGPRSKSFTIQADLTILNVIWAPRMTIMPHNHQMWAVIGIYTGREDNIFWRRVPGGRAASWKPRALRPCARRMPNPSAATSSTP